MYSQGKSEGWKSWEIYKIIVSIKAPNVEIAKELVDRGFDATMSFEDKSIHKPDTQTEESIKSVFIVLTGWEEATEIIGVASTEGLAKEVLMREYRDNTEPMYRKFWWIEEWQLDGKQVREIKIEDIPDGR